MTTIWAKPFLSFFGGGDVDYEPDLTQGRGELETQLTSEPWRSHRAALKRSSELRNTTDNT